VPDIFAVTDLDVKKYATKGLLADIGALMSADGDMKKSDILENVVEYCTIDGVMRTVVPYFSVSTVAGRRDILGDKGYVTWSELFRILREDPERVGFTELERGQLLDNILSATAYQYVDYTTGVCHFESDSFKSLLEFCRTYPETIDWDEYYEDYDWEMALEGYKNGKILFMNTGFYSMYDIVYSYVDMKNNFGRDVAYVGYPSDDGQGSVMRAGLELAVWDSSPFKDEAFDFLKSLLSESSSERYYSFPSNKKEFERQFEELMLEQERIREEAENPSDEPEEPDFDADMPVPLVSNKVAPDLILPNPGTWVEPTVTREEGEAIKDFVTSVSNRAMALDSEIIKMIKEESAAYFDGKKSIDETCRIIQSRVFIFVSENM
jgi:ABC-type glycerol-3-phosphate transport system substrate-binding protein